MRGQFHHAEIVLRGLVESPAFGQRRGEVVMTVVSVFGDRKRAAERTNCQVQPACLRGNQAQPVVRADLTRCQLDDSPINGLGIQELPFTEVTGGTGQRLVEKIVVDTSENLVRRQPLLRLETVRDRRRRATCGAGRESLVCRPERAAPVCTCRRSANSVSTGPQSPAVTCRNNFTVAYQGLSSPATIHRQEGTAGKMVQAGVPTAPARCTVALPTEMTRSSAAILAA